MWVQMPLPCRVVFTGLYYYLCWGVALNMLLLDSRVGALPARSPGRKVCRGLPEDLQRETAFRVTEDGADSQLQPIQLGSYSPGQLIIVSILEDPSDEDDPSRRESRLYALQAISGVNGKAIGRFKSVSPATELHRCGNSTILLDKEARKRNGVVFSWLPPHEGAVQPVTIFVTKV